MKNTFGIILTAIAGANVILFVNSILTTLILAATLVYWIFKIRNERRKAQGEGKA